MKSSNWAPKIRKWSRIFHRDLSFFFSGMILIYAISGFVMNHRDSINPNYSIDRETFRFTKPAEIAKGAGKDEVILLLSALDINEPYLKHYFPSDSKMKVFLKGGSSLEVDLNTEEATYEKLTRRPLLSALTRLHYNPGKWWTYFADAFAIGLMVITLTGMLMMKGPKGFWGRGGIEFVLGILVPLVFLFL